MATAAKTGRQANGQAIAARAASVKALIEAHADEFGQILSAERVSRGLAAEAGGESTKELLTRLEKSEAKAQKAREILLARGVTIPEQNGG